MEDGRRARWAGHRERRRAAFVTAAVQVIDREGPGATVDQIAAELGVTRQALYRQFDDRGDLDRAVVEHASGLLLAHLSVALDVDGGVEQGVRRALTAYLDFVEAHLALYRFVRAHDAGPQGGAVRRVQDAVADTVAGLARRLLPSADGRPAALAEMAAAGLVGMADAVVARWLEDDRGLTRQQVLEELVRLLLGSIEAALAGVPAR